MALIDVSLRYMDTGGNRYVRLDDLIVFFSNIEDAKKKNEEIDPRAIVTLLKNLRRAR